MTVAHLTAGLLARKGDARPSIVNGAEPRPARSAAPPPVRAVASVADEGAGRQHRDDRVRLSLRLDPGRHRRLRLAAVHLDESLQHILTQALDQYLAGLQLHCPCVEAGEDRCGTACADSEALR